MGKPCGRIVGAKGLLEGVGVSRNLGSVLGAAEINELERKVIDAASAGRVEDAEVALRALLDAQVKHRQAALSLLRIVQDGHLSLEKSLKVLTEIKACYPDDIELISWLGDCLERAREVDFLNAPPPDELLFEAVVDTLSRAASDPKYAGNESQILEGLATAARMRARQSDAIAEAAYKRLTELEPHSTQRQYNYGLFLKTRGRFDEGMSANQRAAELSKEIIDRYEWNLGICATGARRGDVALAVWKRMGQKIEMGRFGLPEGLYSQCKVRLAERPLAERTADRDDPGLEETVWIERLSPCHGIIRSVLYQGLGVDYGDVVLIDGAPITYHTYGETQVAVFPHLATLERRHYQFFDFAGTQDSSRELMELSASLDDDAVIYSHSEQYQMLCDACWRNSDIDHDHGETTEKHIVIGRIAAPPGVKPRALLGKLDAAVAQKSSCEIYAPSLSIAAGEQHRADVDRRRFDMLVKN
jgi:tetratricopeptide (TPR) repeat protein